MSLMSIVQPAAAGAIAIAAMAAAAVPQASAQEPNSVQAGPVQAVAGAGQQITLTMGKGGLFQTSAPFAKISVSDDKIVEVTPQSDRELVFNPKGIGSTNVFVFDDKNKLIARLDVNVVPKPVRLQEVREEPYGEMVRVYGRIYDAKGLLNKPATYQCSQRDCELAGETLNARPSPASTQTANPKEVAAPDNGPPPQE
jgi:hypothetical protein